MPKVLATPAASRAVANRSQDNNVVLVNGAMT
jgi:hypothetical protein